MLHGWPRIPPRPGRNPLTYCSVLLSVTLLVRPGWVHYFVATPLALAVLLEHAEGRRLALSCSAVAFLCSSVGLLASLLDPELYWVINRAGLVTWSCLAALLGLWSCTTSRTERDLPGQPMAAI